jgi:hypothetical protein
MLCSATIRKQFVDAGYCQTNAGIRGAVIDKDLGVRGDEDVGISIQSNSSRGEDDIRHLSCKFPNFTRFKDVVPASGDGAPGLAQVVQGDARLIDVYSREVGGNSVVDVQPALFCFEGRRTRADEFVPEMRAS